MQVIYFHKRVVKYRWINEGGINMSDNYSLINMDGISEVVKELLSKISSAIGWIATRETPKRIAVQTYIEEIKQSDYDPITKAALISNAQKTVREYSNQTAIVEYAIENMNGSSTPQQIDDDWLAQFMDKARLVSDSEFQLIWGRILAEECNIPGSVPRSLLHTLERMDRYDAECFVLLCKFAVYFMNGDEKHYMPFIPISSLDSYFFEKGLGVDALVDLRSLGLIEMSLEGLASEFSVHCSSQPIIIHYFEEQFELPTDFDEIYCGNVIFTKTGRALCRAILVEKQENFFEQICIPYLEDAVEKRKKYNK